MLPSDKPRGPDPRGGVWWGSWPAVGDQRLRLEATSRKMTGEVGVDEIPEERGPPRIEKRPGRGPRGGQAVEEALRGEKQCYGVGIGASGCAEGGVNYPAGEDRDHRMCLCWDRALWVDGGIRAAGPPS